MGVVATAAGINLPRLSVGMVFVKFCTQAYALLGALLVIYLIKVVFDKTLDEPLLGSSTNGETQTKKQLL